MTESKEVRIKLHIYKEMSERNDGELKRAEEIVAAALDHVSELYGINYSQPFYEVEWND